MVLEGFAALGLKQESEFTQGADYLSGQTGTTPAQLAWQIIGLANAGRSTDTLRTALIALRRADGTWGAGGSGTPTASYETALALRALRLAENPASNELDVLKALLRRRRANGSFAADGAASSDIEVTGQVLELLDELSGVYMVSPFVNEMVAFLKSSQNADGGWGSGSSNTFDTAYALGLLIAAGDLPSNPSGAVDYLLNSQGGMDPGPREPKIRCMPFGRFSPSTGFDGGGGQHRFQQSFAQRGDVVSVSAEVRSYWPSGFGRFSSPVLRWQSRLWRSRDRRSDRRSQLGSGRQRDCDGLLEHRFHRRHSRSLLRGGFGSGGRRIERRQQRRFGFDFCVGGYRSGNYSIGYYLQSRFPG
jgi:hypothetical protein